MSVAQISLGEIQSCNSGPNYGTDRGAPTSSRKDILPPSRMVQNVARNREPHMVAIFGLGSTLM